MTLKCFVPGCRSGYDSQRKEYKIAKKKNPSLFKPPNVEMYEIWRQVIPRADRQLRMRDRICELHFKHDDIIRYYETKLHDGKTFKLRRGMPTLKASAIPIIFSDLPEYSNNLKKLLERNPMSTTGVKKLSTAHINIENALKSFFMNSLNEAPKFTMKEIRSKRGKQKVDEVILSVKDPNMYSENMPINEEDTDFSINDMNISAEDMPPINVDDANVIEKDINISDEDMCITSEDMSIDAEVTILSTKDNMGTTPQNTYESNKNKCLYFEDRIMPAEDDITFDELVRNLETILKPNASWAISSHGTFVVCVKWSGDHVPEKKVVIDCDLNVKVYIKEEEIISYKNLAVCNLSDVSTILHLLDT